MTDVARKPLDEGPSPAGWVDDGPMTGQPWPEGVMKPRMGQIWVNSATTDPRCVRGPHPSGIGSTQKGIWVEVQHCTTCGTLFPREAKDAASDVCPLCVYSHPPILSNATREAMTNLREAIDEHMRWRERNREKEHQAFITAGRVAWLTAPVLLRALEHLYGRITTSEAA